MILYYGTAAQFNDPAIANRILLYTLGVSQFACADVKDQSSAISYSGDHEGIKSLISSINDAHQKRRISLATKRRRLCDIQVPITEEVVATR